MDAVSRADDAVALVAYVQALVALLAGDRPDKAAAPPHPVLSRENQWRAARYGLGAGVVDPRSGNGERITTLIRRTLRRLEPEARNLGCERELAGMHRILADGNGADRQLAVYAVTSDPRAVARDIARLTVAGDAA